MTEAHCQAECDAVEDCWYFEMEAHAYCLLWKTCTFETTDHDPPESVWARPEETIVTTTTTTTILSTTTAAEEAEEEETAMLNADGARRPSSVAIIPAVIAAVVLMPLSASPVTLRRVSI
eukprot:gnl/TRDRNA2_/TRDRNA2_139192_c0_seq1.p2 gnl/TRDRNA2_/TRDRNA2_139192_c0~~gnl/TRDRNA2_/TRDRNA2_139192_c0_seq1.p2  ORF type:complete len:120 (+),score=19.29 gnl/TRDRNA2_/TRDRNA2_139192_c0_seq1:51-410(+)